MTTVAWMVAVCSFIAYAVALNVGPSCANVAAPWCAAAFFGSFVWLAYRYERRS